MVRQSAPASAAQWPSRMHTPGPMAEHSLSAAQARQVLTGALPLAAIWHTGVIPEHVLLSMHSTHAPVAEQAVCPPKAAHSADAAQARQVLLTVAQIGVAPAQVALLKHSTHALATVLQTPL